jgi:hypothetical protein
MSTNLNNRVRKLEQACGGECDGGPTCFTTARLPLGEYLAGEPADRPEPPAPPGAALCRRCGVPHVVEVVELVVNTREEAQAAFALMSEGASR